MLRLTRAAGSPYRVLHRSRETRHAMTAAVETIRADLDPAPAVPGTAAADTCAWAAASPVADIHGRPTALRSAAPAAICTLDMPHPHAGTA
jgi:hypothetical protein